MPRRTAFAVIASFFVTLASAAGASPTFAPPLDAPIARPFDPARSPYGSGHRGVDYAVGPGTPVRATASGTVSFSGAIPGGHAIAIDHGAGLTSTYTVLQRAIVADGSYVEKGAWIGFADRTHADGPTGLHLGVKVDGRYVDPTRYLTPVDAAGAIHLAPLAQNELQAYVNAPECESPADLADDPPAPNGNVAVAIAGIGSRTEGGIDAALYEQDPSWLGYPSELVYRFSYRGSDGPNLHEPYAAQESWGDIRAAADELRRLLARIKARHPGRAVDLIAHSQGGLVARALLESSADGSGGALPRIEHLVTFATPHRGAPLAGEVDDLEVGTLTGGIALDLLSTWSRHGGPIADPSSIAVQQMAPDSALVAELATEDVSFGTRVLALAIPNDLLVPPDHADVPGHPSRIVGPRGLEGHSGIVGSPAARALAHAFLRDAAPSCPGAWDGWGRLIGRLVSGLEGAVDHLYRAAERAVSRIP